MTVRISAIGSGRVTGTLAAWRRANPPITLKDEQAYTNVTPRTRLRKSHRSPKRQQYILAMDDLRAAHQRDHPPSRQVLSCGEIAKICHRDQMTVNRWIWKRGLPWVRLNVGHMVVDAYVLLRWLEEHPSYLKDATRDESMETLRKLVNVCTENKTDGSGRNTTGKWEGDSVTSVAQDNDQVRGGSVDSDTENQ